MKVMRQFALMLVVLLPLVAPAMVCALPNAQLSPAERACCNQMKGQCGSMEMPASHGCCHKELPTAGHWNAAIQVKPACVPIEMSAIAAVSRAILLPLPLVTSAYEPRPGSTPPHSPPPTISVLRI